MWWQKVIDAAKALYKDEGFRLAAATQRKNALTNRLEKNGKKWRPRKRKRIKNRIAYWEDEITRLTGCNSA